MTIRAWGMPLPNIGSMDGNTGRSEGATAEKAVPFPCAVLDPNRSFVELRVGEPRPGARSVSSPPTAAGIARSYELYRSYAPRRWQAPARRISGGSGRLRDLRLARFVP